MSEESSLEEIKKFWPKDAPDITNVPKYVKKYKKDLIVIKYGGNVLIDRNIFNNFIQDISILNKLGLSIIVVHGGGPRIERELKKENIQSKFINGLRVTDKNVINVIPDKPELGFVGVPHTINMETIKNIISKNQIPIVAPLGLDNDKKTYNINGDTAASAIAKKLKSRRLLLMTNVEGVYDDRKTLISEIKPYDMENLVNLKIIQGGMLPKIKNCIDAVENGVRGVVILDGRKPRAILKEIFSDQGAGTLIRK